MRFDRLLRGSETKPELPHCANKNATTAHLGSHSRKQLLKSIPKTQNCLGPFVSQSSVAFGSTRSNRPVKRKEGDADIADRTNDGTRKTTNFERQKQESQQQRGNAHARKSVCRSFQRLAQQFAFTNERSLLRPTAALETAIQTALNPYFHHHKPKTISLFSFDFLHNISLTTRKRKRAKQTKRNNKKNSKQFKTIQKSHILLTLPPSPLHSPPAIRQFISRSACFFFSLFFSPPRRLFLF